MKLDGGRIRALREERGWSQEQLAAVSGLSARTVQRLEKNGTASLESRSALAVAFGIKPVELDINESRAAEVVNLLARLERQVGERLLRQGYANLQRGRETVGGLVCLTSQNLYFDAHSVNINKGQTKIPLSEVELVFPCWTKFLGLIPIFPNSLCVRTMDGVEYRFVLWGREVWQKLILAQVVAAKAK